MHHEGDPTMILAPGLDEQQDDIQALLGSGLGWLKASRFRLLTITDPAAARRWLGELATKGLVASVAQVIDRALRPQQLCAVAFSHAGLDRLGVTPAEDFPFPTAFRSGQGSSLRQSLLRDPPRDEWQWSDCSEVAGVAAAHILLGHWWPDGAELSLPALTGVATVREVNGCPRFFNRGFLEEPFGFRDGLSQPLILGLRPDDGSAAPGPAPSTLRPEARDHVIAAGEFILGYRNEYNELSYCPDVQGWSPPPRGPAACSRFALNGSYLAVREIEQHVEAYRAFDRGRAQVAGCPAGASAGELMMGRRRDGRPLTSPAEPPPGPVDTKNDFRYRVEDAQGFITPPGSHVRRSNPRDTLGHDVASGIRSAKLHRLLRRGRPFRRDDQSVGMFFIACNTDLERQFEFVLQRWIHNPGFAGLEQQDDPLVGEYGARARRNLSLPGLPAGQCLSLASLTTTVGGGYFFLPGLRAFKFIAQVRAEPAR
jgi:putative iron-dependent peroxidase